MTEAQLQDAIATYARTIGWTVAHFRPARTNQGWRTAGAYDAAGFPDLVLVRGPRLIFAELKSHSGKVRPDQQWWLDRLETTPAEVYVWRPDDWPSTVTRVLPAWTTEEVPAP